MPSVGMRRSTRVFGARVLRSGRRLWSEPREGSKYMGAPSGGNEWIDLLDNSADGGGGAGDRLKDRRLDDGNVAAMDIVVESKAEEPASVEAVEVEKLDKMCGKVYRRKRKRDVSTSPGFSEDERFAKKFVRRKWRRVCWDTDSSSIRGRLQPPVRRVSELAVFAATSSYDSLYWISRILCSVLSYMSKVRTEVPQLAAFLLSEPICGAYSSHGVCFLQEVVTVKKPGVCVISGCRLLMPFFVVDFAAIPFCFMNIHRSMYLRSVNLSCLVTHPLGPSEKDVNQEMEVEYEVEETSQIPSIGDSYDCVAVGSQSWPKEDVSCNDTLASDNKDMMRADLSLSVVGPKPVLRTMQLGKIRKIQKKRRSSFRLRRRRPSGLRNQKASAASSSEFLKIRHDASQISSAVSTRVLRSSSAKKYSNAEIEELKSAQAVLPLDVNANSCSANLLVIETDKCYRDEGVVINLEQSASKHWFVSVMKDGVKRYAMTAQKVMKPPCFNRFTHATVWAADNGWKLEFPDKQDWLIFKELYKECSDRNSQASAASVIPVPGVQEVSDPHYSNYVPYVRPESYISVKDDELTRALMKKCANYDMDSDDEEWLKKFNNELLAQRDHQDLVTPEQFELIIDALEKGSHSHSGDYAIYHLETKNVLEAVREYWSRKRKQKRSALVRIFQLYKPRRTQVIPKSVFRKKRSFKRRASQSGRGKQWTLLQSLRPEIAAEPDAFEQRNKLQKVQEAKAAADRSEEIAVLKRQRAQVLMENADLAAYKALMAIRIAEAAQLADAPPGSVASFFIG